MPPRPISATPDARSPLLPIEDALALPEQPNLPGTIDEHPNWRRRLAAPADALAAPPRSCLSPGRAASGPLCVTMTTTTPGATARLQLHRDFTFDDAAACVPYLAELGDHATSTPRRSCARARDRCMATTSSTTARSIRNSAARTGLRRLVAELRRHELGLIVDIVPNHMGVGGADNAWWLDVLEWGRASPYADFFDIDWNPPDPELRGKVLVPFLGEPYGTCLERGDIRLRFDDGPPGCDLRRARLSDRLRLLPDRAGTGRGRVAGHDRRAAHPHGDARRRREGPRRAARAGWRPRPGRPQWRKRWSGIRRTRRRDASACTACWSASTTGWSGGRRRRTKSTGADSSTSPPSPGMRVELPQVFDATHATLLRLYGAGLIDGVRIDHIDGLADPRAYCRKLRRRLDTEAATRPADAPAGPAYIVVEKILDRP